MIHAVLIFNNLGKPRLSKFFSPSPAHVRSRLVSQLYQLIAARPDAACNFVEIPAAEAVDWLGEEPDATGSEKGKEREQYAAGKDRLKVVYRHYATLYFAFVVDEAESELGILDLIQVFVESLDRCFTNVCELDLIFEFPSVHLLLSQIVVGGLVLDTSTESVAAGFKSQMKARKASAKGNSALGSLEGLQGMGAITAAGSGWRPFGR